MSVKEEIAPVSASQTAAPPSLLDEIMAQTRVQPKSESYDITRQGVSAFIAAMLQGDSSAEPINILAVDAMIADIDARTSRQMDAIIHAPEFQELESLLRSLKLLVERADTRENIKVHFLNVTQEELLDDFEFAPEITQSAYYKHVYSSGYGQFGGEPVAAVIGNFAFKNTTPDMKLLKYISQVSAMAHSRSCRQYHPNFSVWIHGQSYRGSKNRVPSLKARPTPAGAPCVNRKIPVTWA